MNARIVGSILVGLLALAVTGSVLVAQTYPSCEDVPPEHLRQDTQERVAVPAHLVPSQPDGDGDGFACGGQLEHKRTLVTRAQEPEVPRRAGDDVRYTPTNEAYGACRAAFPYSHVDDCAVDYDWLMQFWLANRDRSNDPTPPPTPRPTHTPTPRSTPTPEPTPSAVTVKTLVDAWDSNSIRADRTYKGRTITIEGHLESISTNFGISIVSLNDGSQFAIGGVSCTMKRGQQDQLATLNKGERIVVRGRVEGLSLWWIDVADCELLGVYR